MHVVHTGEPARPQTVATSRQVRCRSKIPPDLAAATRSSTSLHAAAARHSCHLQSRTISVYATTPFGTRANKDAHTYEIVRRGYILRVPNTRMKQERRRGILRALIEGDAIYGHRRRMPRIPANNNKITPTPSRSTHAQATKSSDIAKGLGAVLQSPPCTSSRPVASQ